MFPARSRHSARALALCAIAVLAVACRRQPPPAAEAVSGPPAPPRRVLLVTIDTLRADHLSAHGYPRATSPQFDRWAAAGRMFERAIAQWPKTGSSFASMFTGRYPQTTGLMHSAAIRIPDDITTLPEFFRTQGYRTAAVVSNPVLTSRLGWNRGFDEYLETWGSGDLPEDPGVNRPLFSAQRVNELALPLLERHAADDKFFLWLHYTDPHAPYMLPAGIPNPFLGDAHYAAAGSHRVEPAEARGKLIGKERELRFYVAQYDANVLYTDGKIHEALEKARAVGLLEDALLVITADHGESLGEHQSYFEHGPLAYNTTLHVPLVFAFPGRDLKPARIASPVELVDLFPTFRDLIASGAEIAGLEGKSLLPLLGAAAPGPEAAGAFQVAFAGAGRRSPYTHYRSVQDSRWKLIFLPASTDRRDQREREQWELYDLAADPLETRNLATVQIEEVRRLRRELLGWVKEDRWSGQDEATIAANDREVRQALKALGYIK